MECVTVCHKKATQINLVYKTPSVAESSASLYTGWINRLI